MPRTTSVWVATGLAVLASGSMAGPRRLVVAAAPVAVRHVVVVTDVAPDATRNREAFKTLLRLATTRGVHVKVGIWEHIYRGGGQRGAVPGTSDGT